MGALLSLKTKIVTPLVDESRDWYRDLFGMVVVEEWDEPDDRGCILLCRSESGETFLEIHHSEKLSDFGGFGLQFRVDDVDRFAGPDEPRFAFEGPVDRPWGSRYCFFSDPNGISVVV